MVYCLQASLSGAVIGLGCSLRKSILKNRFEVTFVSPSQAVIRDIVSGPGQGEQQGPSQALVRSKKNYEITDIRVMGRSNRYAVGYTIYTLIFTDMATNLVHSLKQNILI
jgi:intraflagellar transport protein 172